jgi:fatty-acid desaturase
LAQLVWPYGLCRWSGFRHGGWRHQRHRALLGLSQFRGADASTNIVPWGILIGGEELHNNHHTYPTSAKFSVKPYEFDIGWIYISLMEKVGWPGQEDTSQASIGQYSSLWPTKRRWRH